MRSAIPAVLILLGIAPLRAQETRATITGVVSDPLGRPLAGVTVLVEGSAFRTETDATGAFRTEGLTGGVYMISFHRRGFAPRTFRVDLPRGHRGDHALGQVMLQPAGEGLVRLTGTVRDSATMEPVPGMTVGLYERIATFTDRDGTFRIDNVRFGSAYLEARRIGYRPFAIHLDINEGESFNLDIRVSSLPVPLEDVEVTVGEDFSTFGPLRGLMRRRRVGQGYSFLRWEIDEQNPLYITDLFRMLPGVQVRSNRFGGQSILIRGRCGPTVYINGIQMDSVSGLDFLVHPDNVEAVEIHLGAYTPVEYRNYNACGVVAVWTR